MQDDDLSHLVAIAAKLDEARAAVEELSRELRQEVVRLNDTGVSATVMAARLGLTRGRIGHFLAEGRRQ